MNKHLTTPQLVRQEIDRLHRQGKGGDWKTILGQVDAQYQPIRYNLAQALAWLIPPTVKQLDLEWGRGTGKTTVFARFARQIAMDLPRGCFQWEVPTYQKFLTEIIPAFIHALEMQGLYKDLHYFIGRRPPAAWKWDEPYKPPLRYDNFITFWTGFGIHLISQDVAGAGRGLSTDGRFADESAMLDKRKLEEDSGPSIRGSNYKILGGKRWFDFRLMASSTPLTEAGMWFIEQEEQAQLAPMRHKFMRANCLQNIQLGFLKPDYLDEARRTCAEQWVFEAEYLNIRPRLTRGGFYALLDETRHAYVNFNYNHYGNQIGLQPDCRGDADLVAGLPLVIGVDWGAAINSMSISQTPPGEFRTLKCLFTLGRDGETQDDLADRFHEYYQYHDQREVWFFYDQTGNISTGNTKLTRAQQMEQALTSKGWRVRRMSLGGTNPRHADKYFLWEQILQENNPRLPRFRINRQNARELYLSMLRAKAKRGQDGGVRKDKSGERSDSKNRQLATDLSDAHDQPVFGLFFPLLRGMGASLPDSSMHRR